MLFLQGSTWIFFFVSRLLVGVLMWSCAFKHYLCVDGSLMGILRTDLSPCSIFTCMCNKCLRLTMPKQNSWLLLALNFPVAQFPAFSVSVKDSTIFTDLQKKFWGGHSWWLCFLQPPIQSVRSTDDPTSLKYVNFFQFSVFTATLSQKLPGQYTKFLPGLPAFTCAPSSLNISRIFTCLLLFSFKCDYEKFQTFKVERRVQWIPMYPLSRFNNYQSSIINYFNYIFMWSPPQTHAEILTRQISDIGSFLSENTSVYTCWKIRTLFLF